MRTRFLILLIAFCSTYCQAEEGYHGLIWGQIVEDNGHVFVGYEGFEDIGAFEDKQVIYFYQERGQKVRMSGSDIWEVDSKSQKYHMLVTILERNEDEFKADLNIFKNVIEFDEEKQSHALVSRKIKNILVSGQLNIKNEYSFVDDNLPNIKVFLNIDRTFNKAEILARMQATITSKKP